MVGQNNSHINVHEVGVAAKLAIYLLQQGYDPSRITILTMYGGQRLKLLDKLRQSIVAGAIDIRVSTVDGFQGEENDIIILSLVRSNNNNSIGFLKTSNRVCVGLSRAKMVITMSYDFIGYKTLTPI
jgi:superfamily I DNA and/or RNA helicase